jgi:hypothetical protein
MEKRQDPKIRGNDEKGHYRHIYLIQTSKRSPSVQAISRDITLIFYRVVQARESISNLYRSALKLVHFLRDFAYHENPHFQENFPAQTRTMWKSEIFRGDRSLSALSTMEIVDLYLIPIKSYEERKLSKMSIFAYTG